MTHDDGQDTLERRSGGRGGRSRFTVTVKLCAIKPKSIGVTDGALEDWQDPRTGEIRTREKWVWLARSQIRWDEPAEPGTVIEVDVPEWLAQQAGLI